MSVYKLPVSEKYLAFHVSKSTIQQRTWAQHYVKSNGEEVYAFSSIVETEILSVSTETSALPPGFGTGYQFEFDADYQYALKQAALLLGVEAVYQLSSLGHDTPEFTTFEVVNPPDEQGVSSGWYHETVHSVSISDYGVSSDYDDDDFAVDVMSILLLWLLLALLLSSSASHSTLEEIWERKIRFYKNS